MRWRLAHLGALAICVSVFMGMGSTPSTVFFVSPWVLMVACIGYLHADRISLVLAVSGCFGLSVWAFVTSGNLVFLGLLLLVSMIFITFILYVKRWDHEIVDAELKNSDLKRQGHALRSRYEARNESLTHLEYRVGSLLDLFEIARDFNECLSFLELLQAIEERISEKLTFKRGAIALLESADGAELRVGRALSFGYEKRADKEITQKFSEVCFRYVEVTKQVVRIDLKENEDREKFDALDATEPVWVFPLVAEHRLIAMMIIEGANDNDLPSFELLASQLALQVKKIQLYETVREISIVDGLTKTFVRRHFLERFREELKRAVRYRFPLSVLMLDVDDFKSYNDKFGHLVGDRTLREVAEIIKENVRPVDVIGRYGGEEFIVIAPEVGKEKGVELAERIRSSVARARLRIYDEETRITLSVGVSAFPEHLDGQGDHQYSDDFVDTLIKKADHALYRSKEEGRNRVTVYL